MILQATDIFLSEEDLDLETLTDEELSAVYEAWLIAAAATARLRNTCTAIARKIAPSVTAVPP